jgi:hypothetical protein
MTTFTIDAENSISAFASTGEANNNNAEVEHFSSAKQLNRLAAKWPATRLVEIWNSLPGQKPVKKFTSRDKAVARIWEAIQTLVPDTGAPRGVWRRRKPGRGNGPRRKANPPRRAQAAIRPRFWSC